MKILNLLVLSGLSLIACSHPERGEEWTAAKSQLIGKSYDDIISCAGPPGYEREKSPDTGIIQYSDDPTYGFCHINLTVKNGRVASISEVVREQTTDFGYDISRAYSTCTALMRACVPHH